MMWIWLLRLLLGDPDQPTNGRMAGDPDDVGP
jgi:hypothetical protein